MKKILLLTVVLLVSITSAFAQFSGGTGTSGDPYQISTATELEQLATDVSGGTAYANTYFELTADIDISGYSAALHSLGSGWIPIGTWTAPFRGHFDGAGFKVTGLEMDISVGSIWGLYGGLFGTIVNGSIRNLGVEIGDAGVKASSSNDPASTSASVFIGGLVGRSENSDIENCSVVGGDVYGITNNGMHEVFAGGLVGRCWNDNLTTGSVTNSFATVNVSGLSLDYLSKNGGLVGASLYLPIENCYATGNVNGRAFVDVPAMSGGAADTGGLVGASYESTIKNSYATGTITLEFYDDDEWLYLSWGHIGSLAGINDVNSTIDNSYARLESTLYGTILAGGTGSITNSGDVSLIVGGLGSGWDPDIWGAFENGLPYLKGVTTTHQITFVGATISPITVPSGNVITEPATPTRTGYTFQGWTSGGTPYDFSDPVTGDLTLTAVWEVIQASQPPASGSNSTYAVDFIATEGVSVNRNVENTVREGYNFQFEVTIADEYTGYNLTVYVNNVELTPYSSNIYLIEDIRYDSTITFKLTKNDNTTANELITNAVRIWTTSGQIHIEKDAPLGIQIVSLSGSILYEARASNLSVSVPAGIYIIVIGNEVKKVVVR
jgi:Listeria/Bacterioides repeat